MKIFLKKYWHFLLLFIPLAVLIVSIWDKNYYIGGDVMIPLYKSNILNKIFLWNSNGESLEPLHLLWYLYFGFFSVLGFQGYVAQKTLIILLFIIGFVFSYLLYKELFVDKYKNQLSPYLSGLVFIISPVYFLLVTTYLPLYGFPICLFFLVKYLKNKNLSNIVLYSLCFNFFLLIDLPQPKIVIVFFLVSLGILTLVKGSSSVSYSKLIYRYLTINFFAVILNSWVFIPYFYSIFFGAVKVFSENVASHQGVADLHSATLLYITRFFNHSIVNLYPVIGKFLLSPIFIIWSFINLTILVFHFLHTEKKNKKKQLLIYLYMLAFLFIAKGPNPPFGGIYTKLILSVPILRIFRTTSSVVIAALIFYSFLVPKALAELAIKLKNNSIYPIYIIITIALSFPFFFGYKYFNVFAVKGEKGFRIPSEYFAMSKKMEELDDGYSLLELPFPDGYVMKNWSYMGADLLYWSSNKDTIRRVDISGLSLEKNNFKNLDINDTYLLNNTSHVLIQKDTYDSLNCDTKKIGKEIYSDKYFTLLEVNKLNYYPKIYIPNKIVSMGSDITNKENILTFVDPSLKSSLCVTIDDNINNQSYESIASVLPQIIPNIRTVDKAKEAVIKKTLVVFKIKNPTQYLVSIKGISRQELLVLNEKYNSEWVVFGDKGGFLNKKLVSNGTLHKGSVLMSGDVEYKNYSSWLNNQAIKNTSHILANGYANGWIVDPVMVCKESPQSCTKNPDGSYDISLIIEFWPQRLFYLGLFISGTTLFGLTGYSVYTWYKESKINRKKNENYKNQ